ncbi:MAG: Cdc6/Cdc18 family protein [Candidatus Odinarchaeota archaeon]
MLNSNLDEIDDLFDESVFKDERTLAQHYVPPDLPHRKEEKLTILGNFRSLLKQRPRTTDGTTAFSCNIVVLGQAGIGKTATVKHTTEILKEITGKEGIRLIVSYVDCHTNRTLNSILAYIMRENFGINTRGLRAEEVISDLKEQLSRKDIYLVLILDEVHILKNPDIEVFLHLTDWLSGRISLILISRVAEWTSIVDSNINQRILDTLKFKPYNKEAMYSIFEFRVALAFNDDTVSEGIIDMVVSIAEKTQNIRHGIETLYRAGKIADRKKSKKIYPEYIREAKGSVFPEIHPRILRELKDHELYTALAIARHLENQNLVGMTIWLAYRCYQSIAEQLEVVPKCESAFRDYIDALYRFGLIGKLSSKRNRSRGNAGLMITIQDVPAKILKERIEEFLELTANQHDE